MCWLVFVFHTHLLYYSFWCMCVVSGQNRGYMHRNFTYMVIIMRNKKQNKNQKTSNTHPQNSEKENTLLISTYAFLWPAPSACPTFACCSSHPCHFLLSSSKLLLLLLLCCVAPYLGQYALCTRKWLSAAFLLTLSCFCFHLDGYSV